MQAELPFANTHSDRSLFLTEAWRDSLARLNEGLGVRQPFLLVTGEAGTGKTALVLEAAARWEARASVAFLANPALTRAELVEEIARRFGADPPAGASKPQLLACLERTLTDVAARSQVPVLVIEEAHRLDVELLDELRLIVNSEAQAQRPLEAVLVGLPALDARLAEPALEQLRQRIAVHCHMKPLSHKETRHYVHHRVRAVGGDGPKLFPRKTCSELHDLSGGVPRTINTLATEAMRRAKEAGSDSVNVEHVEAAAAALKIVAPVSEPTAVAPAARARTTRAAAAPQKPPSREPRTTPVAAQPVAAQPVAAQPVAAQPVAAQPVAAQPVAAQPVAAQPVAAKTAAAQPVAAQTVAAEPDAAQAEDAELVAAHASAAVASETSRSDHAAGAPVASEPAAAAPVASEPAAAVPAAEPGEMLALHPPSEPDVPSDDPRVRDWVSRFVGDEGPPRVGSAFGAMTPAEIDASLENEASTPHPAGRPVKFIPLVEDEPAVATAVLDEPAKPAPRAPAAPPRGAPGRASWISGVSLAIAVFAITGVGTVMVLTHGEHLMPGDGSASAVAQPDSSAGTSTPSGTDQDTWSLRPPMTSVDPSETTGTSLSPDVRPGSTPAESAQTTATPPEGSPDRTEAEATPAAKPRKQRLAIEVATFIDAERARLECTRLEAETGLHAWVVTASEYGGQSYRVRLGMFNNSERAETTASSLLERGIISESRVVELPTKRGRRSRR